MTRVPQTWMCPKVYTKPKRKGCFGKLFVGALDSVPCVPCGIRHLNSCWLGLTGLICNGNGCDLGTDWSNTIGFVMFVATRCCGQHWGTKCKAHVMGTPTLASSTTWTCPLVWNGNTVMALSENATQPFWVFFVFVLSRISVSFSAFSYCKS